METHKDGCIEEIELQFHNSVFRIDYAVSNDVPKIFVRISGIVIFFSGHHEIFRRVGFREKNVEFFLNESPETKRD